MEKKHLKQTKRINGINKQGKHVRWATMPTANYEIPSVDFFNDFAEQNGVLIDQQHISSDTMHLLNSQADAYANKLQKTNPIKAGIPVDPNNLENRYNWNSQQIVNTEDANTRVLEYRTDPNMAHGETVGEVYDNLVDNFRVQWGKFNGLGAYDSSNHYDVNEIPNPGFATY